MDKSARVAAAVWLVAAMAQAGVQFTTLTKTEGGKGHDGQPMTVQSAVDGEKGRFEFMGKTGSPGMGEGTYIVTSDGGKTMYMVSPKDKTYMKWDMQAMMGAAGAAMQMAKGFMSMKISDPKVEKISEESGESICGISTRVYRFRTSYGMEMSVMGMKNASTVVQEEQVWATTRLADAAMGAWMKGQEVKFGDEQMDALVRAEREKALKGFPLKRMVVTTTTDNRGKTSVTKTIMEVTDLKQGAVPASQFEIPADYKETSLTPPPTDEETGKRGEAKSKPGATESPVNQLMKFFPKR